MQLWENFTTTGDDGGPGFPGPADTLTTAQARDLDADRLAQLEARVHELRRFCSGLAAQVAGLQGDFRAGAKIDGQGRALGAE